MMYYKKLELLATYLLLYNPDLSEKEPYQGIGETEKSHYCQVEHDHKVDFVASERHQHTPHRRVCNISRPDDVHRSSYAQRGIYCKQIRKHYIIIFK